LRLGGAVFIQRRTWPASRGTKKLVVVFGHWRLPKLRKEVQAFQGYRLWSSDLDAHRPTGGTAVDDEKPVCSMRIAA
jgi:hypothetical protein